MQVLALVPTLTRERQRLYVAYPMGHLSRLLLSIPQLIHMIKDL